MAGNIRDITGKCAGTGSRILDAVDYRARYFVESCNLEGGIFRVHASVSLTMVLRILWLVHFTGFFLPIFFHALVMNDLLVYLGQVVIDLDVQFSSQLKS